MILAWNSYLLLTWLSPSDWPKMLEETDQSVKDNPYWRVRWVYDDLEYVRSLYVRVAGLEASILV